jgi:hypothetical protein
VVIRSSVPNRRVRRVLGHIRGEPARGGHRCAADRREPRPARRHQRAPTILDTTATDKSDQSCGGTAGNNNVYGQGRLNAFAAVGAAKAARKS